MAAVKGVALILAAALAAGAGLAQTARTPRSVTVAAVSDAFAPATLDAFTRETGVRLLLDAFPTAEAVEAAVARGGYDAAVVSGPALARLEKAGKLARLDAAAIPALAGLDPTLARLAPGGAVLGYSPWGVAVDARRARERLGERALESWEQALRPDIWKAFADCGVALPDEPAAMIAAATLALRLDPQARRPADARRALDRLAQLRGAAKSVAAQAAIVADLAAGDLCLAPMTAADAAQAAARAQAAGEETAIVFAAMKEGAPAALDALAILRAAAHPAEAASFLDFVLRPEQAAQASARTGFANAVPASRDRIGAEPAGAATLFPDAATAAKLFVPAPWDDPTQTQIARDWARIRSGK